MPEFDVPAIFRNFMGAFRFGRGFLGKSSNALIALIVLLGIAVYRLKSDDLIIVVTCLGVGAFLVWYFRAERFAYKHPLEALLEGGEYTAHQQMLLASKDHPSGLFDPSLQVRTIGAEESTPPAAGAEVVEP